jgi:uncharacterized protein YcsI (UPF0317 family)
MFQRRDFVILLASAYGMLAIVVFFEQKHSNNKIIKLPCEWDDPCVRFCCRNKTLCSKDKNIRENFKTPFLKKFSNDADAEADAEFYKILHGKPTCASMETVNDGEWSFDMVSRVHLLI